MQMRLTKEIISSRTMRNDLPTMDFPRWVELEKGRHIGYCKGMGVQSWFVRLRLKEHRYQQFQMGSADDVLKANGEDVLDYKQAVAKAMEWDTLRSGNVIEPVRAYEREDRYPDLPDSPPYTVAHAIVDFLKSYEHQQRSFPSMYYDCMAHTLPLLGSIPLIDLDARTIRLWLDKLSETPARLRSVRNGEINYSPKSNDPDTKRKRQNTVNRTLRNLKTILNRAYEYGFVNDPSPWRRIRPYRGVNHPRTRYLEFSQCKELVDACPPALGQLTQGALLTGCRISELQAMTVADFKPDLKRILIHEGKGRRTRHVSLSTEGVSFFCKLTKKRQGCDRVFVRDNGTPWTTATHLRQFHNVCVSIGIDPPLNFHALRHTYATHLAMAGIPFEVLAKQLGHKDTRMVQRHYAHLGNSYVDDIITRQMPVFFGDK